MEQKDSLTFIAVRDADQSSMVVTLEPDGLITIQDYSHQGDRNRFLNILKRLGVETEVVSEDLMGFHDVPRHKQMIYEKLKEGEPEGEISNE